MGEYGETDQTAAVHVPAGH